MAIINNMPAGSGGGKYVKGSLSKNDFVASDFKNVGLQSLYNYQPVSLPVSWFYISKLKLGFIPSRLNVVCKRTSTTNYTYLSYYILTNINSEVSNGKIAFFARGSNPSGTSQPSYPYDKVGDSSSLNNSIVFNQTDISKVYVPTFVTDKFSQTIDLSIEYEAWE